LLLNPVFNVAVRGGAKGDAEEERGQLERPWKGAKESTAQLKGRSLGGPESSRVVW
jgi:hypothetical protein